MPCPLWDDGALTVGVLVFREGGGREPFQAVVLRPATVVTDSRPQRGLTTVAYTSTTSLGGRPSCRAGSVRVWR